MIIHFITLLTVSDDSLAEVVGGWPMTVRSLGKYRMYNIPSFLSTKLNLDLFVECTEFLLQIIAYSFTAHTIDLYRRLELTSLFYIFFVGMVWLPCCLLLPSSTYCVLAFSTPGLLNKSFFRKQFFVIFCY